MKGLFQSGVGQRVCDTASEAHICKAESAPDAVACLVGQLPSLDLFKRLAAIRACIPGRIVFTTSFGLEDQAIAHAAYSQQLDIEVATLDTGRLFAETHEVWSETEKRYGVRVRAFAPESSDVEALVARHGINGFRSSVSARHACCHVRKVLPLGRALENAACWITGVRAEQSPQRADAGFAAVDRGLVKVNPLFDWTRSDVAAFVEEHRLPYNALHDRGFVSIGCAPCTRAVRRGESERAGRWWWEQVEKKECGLHSWNEMRTSPRHFVSDCL